MRTVFLVLHHVSLITPLTALNWFTYFFAILKNLPTTEGLMSKFVKINTKNTR